MDNKELDKVLEHAYDRLQRANPRSKQPRLKGNGREVGELYTSVLNWTRFAKDTEPPYREDSRLRDEWLSEFWTEEAHWSGVISSVNMIDANRGWVMIGGRNQVARFVPILKNADDGAGWRQWISQQSTGFYTTDIGPVTEVGRDGVGGPMRALYHTDPTKCYLTGDREFPLRHTDVQKPWRPDDYFRLVSMKNIKDKYRGLGICATSRALDMAKLMLGIYGHQMEMIGARAPKGLLLLQNITQSQWDEAMKIRDAKLDSDMRRYYNAVAVIAQSGVDAIDAKLVALSQLPEGFNLEIFTNLLMYAYALCIGYDPIEFWPVTAGQLGRGRETDIQHRKGTGKGGLNFMLAMQEAIQGELPDTLNFEFEQRDQEGMLLDVKVAQEAANLVTTLYAGKGSQVPGPRGEQGGEGDPAVKPLAPTLEPLISWEEARSLLAKYDVIPDSWTQVEEQAKATDAAGIERLRREELMENETIRRAAYQYPHEPIVRYRWPHDKAQVLFRRGEDALKAERYSLVKPVALIPDFSLDEGEEIETTGRVVPESEEEKVHANVNISEQPEEKIFFEGWVIKQGAPDRLEVTVRDPNRKEISSISRSQKISFYVFDAQGQPVLSKELGTGVEVSGAVIRVDISPQETSILEGEYSCAIRVRDDFGRTYSVFKEKLTVLKDSVDA